MNAHTLPKLLQLFLNTQSNTLLPRGWPPPFPPKPKLPSATQSGAFWACQFGGSMNINFVSWTKLLKYSIKLFTGCVYKAPMKHTWNSPMDLEPFSRMHHYVCASTIACFFTVTIHSEKFIIRSLWTSTNCDRQTSMAPPSHMLSVIDINIRWHAHDYASKSETS